MRLALLFAASYCLNVIVHELAHALTASALGVPATLYNFYVDIDQARATAGQRAWIGAVGPLASLGVGLVAWWTRPLVRRLRPSSELRVFYVAVFGISFGLGNLFSASFVGDVSTVMQLFDVPMPVRYAVTALAAIGLCTFMYVVGRELHAWSRPGATRPDAVTRLIVVPVLAGTLAVIVINLPMPRHFVAGWISPTFFWAFAAAGVVFSRVPPGREAWGGPTRLGDLVFVLLVAVIVRVLSGGIVIAG